MYLLYDQVLVVRSANSILFFKKNEQGLYSQYYEFPELRGQIYFIRGNIRI